MIWILKTTHLPLYPFLHYWNRTLFCIKQSVYIYRWINRSIQEEGIGSINKIQTIKVGFKSSGLIQTLLTTAVQLAVLRTHWHIGLQLLISVPDVFYILQHHHHHHHQLPCTKWMSANFYFPHYFLKFKKFSKMLLDENKK